MSDKRTFSVQDVVNTMHANESLRREWVKTVWEARQWGIKGPIVIADYRHECYSVRHPDGTIGVYDASEIERAQ